MGEIKKYNLLSIESDGTSFGTVVKDSNGNSIDYIQSIKWEIDVNSLATCELKIIKVPIKLKNVKIKTEIN